MTITTTDMTTASGWKRQGYRGGQSRFDAIRQRAQEARARLEIPAGVRRFPGIISSVPSGRGLCPARRQLLNISNARFNSAGSGQRGFARRPSPDAAVATAASGISASLEQLNFSATGTIKTGDGKEVNFTLSLNLTKASVAGFSASSAAAGQDPLSVNFAGSSSELFSMSFEFSINMGEDAEAEEGTGLFTIDKDDDTTEADEASAGTPGAQQTDTAISAADFLKALRKAEFTSTYLSFSKTTIEATTSSIAVAEGPPIDAYQIPAPSASASVPLDLVA
jgi:hypothetical protein